MRASACIGRVGGLAVVLGVGLAVMGPGGAWASPTETTSTEYSDERTSASEAASTGSAASHPAARAGAVAARGKAANPASSTAGRDPSSSDFADNGPESTAAPASERDQLAEADIALAGQDSATAVAPRTAAAALDELTLVERVAEDIGTPLPEDLPEVAELAVGADRPVAASGELVGQVADLAVTVGTGSPTDPVIAATEAAQPVDREDGVESVFDPSSGPDPLVPFGTAASWVMVAASRRELVTPARASSTSEAAAVPSAATPALSEVSAASAITPKDTIDLAFSGFNSTIGWIPVVGTVINAVKFGIDAFGLIGSVFALDFNQAITELGNLVVDLIGMVPVIGGPIAALLYQTVLGGNVKLAGFVQESLQSYFDVDSTWSEFQFNVETVDVPIGLGGTQASTATVSKPGKGGVGDLVDVINNGFETGWSVPLQGRLQLLSLAYS